MALLSRVLHGNDKSDRPLPGSRTHSSPLVLAITPVASNLTILSGAIASPGSPGAPLTYSLTIALESPPVALYGHANESTGSIISGILSLDIKHHEHRGKRSRLSLNQNIHDLVPVSSLASMASLDPPPFQELELASVTLSLVQTMKYSKTFTVPSNAVANCKDCGIKKTTLARWDVLTSAASFPVGTHAYPFSHLLPGLLPASCKLGSAQSSSFIKYDLIAVGTSARTGKETTVRLPLNISRLILRGPDRNSLRVFPPTEVTASAVLPNVVYPKSTFPVELKLDNVVSALNDRRWRMRKLAWRIEETTKIRADVCEKHAGKLKSTEESQRKIDLHKDLSAAPPHKNSNLHHSTIQTNMMLMANPVDERAPAENVDLVLEDDPDNDMEGTLTSGPSRAHDNFIEDFIGAESSRPLAVDGSSDPHVAPPTPPEPARDHLYLEEIRTVNHGEIKSGWKSDFSGRGRIELVADINASNFSTGYTRHVNRRSSTDPKTDDLQEGLRNGANVACDVEDKTLGVFVHHTLVVEVVVAEELIHNMEKRPPKTVRESPSLTPVASNSLATTPNPQMGVPTGAARVLRMQFKIIVTERSGLGIAWDDEVPPTYDDIRTLSPPTYQDSNGGTPTHTPLLTPLLGAMPTPPAPARVIYGIGDTPNMRSIDGLVGFEELSLEH